MFSPGIAGIDYGWIVVNTGVMFGGKSSSLIHQVDKIRRFDDVRLAAAKRENRKISKLSIGVYKHSIDKRYSPTDIVSHTGVTLSAKPVGTVEQLVLEVESFNYRVVAIDEIQFFNDKNEQGEYLITHALKQFERDNRMVIVSGLDKDFRGMPFGPMGDILAIAHERHTHTSTCAKCGAPATLPQRLVDSKPAFYDDPVVMPGASEVYEPRCVKCHEIRYREVKNTKIVG